MFSKKYNACQHGDSQSCKSKPGTVRDFPEFIAAGLFHRIEAAVRAVVTGYGREKIAGPVRIDHLVGLLPGVGGLRKLIIQQAGGNLVALNGLYR